MKFFTAKKLVLGLLAFSFLFVPVISFAQSNPTLGGVSNPINGGVSNPHSVTLDNPLGVKSISELVAKILNAAIIIGIPIAVLFIVLAGFKFVLAQGKPKDLDTARKNLVSTLIGIAIFVGASLIATVIINTLKILGVQGL